MSGSDLETQVALWRSVRLGLLWGGTTYGSNLIVNALSPSGLFASLIQMTTTSRSETSPFVLHQLRPQRIERYPHEGEAGGETMTPSPFNVYGSGTARAGTHALRRIWRLFREHWALRISCSQAMKTPTCSRTSPP